MNAHRVGKKIKLYQILQFFHRKVSLNSVCYDNGISFPFGMLQGLSFGQKLCFFTMKHIKIRKSFIAYRSPLCQQKLLPVYVFTYFAQYMKVTCWHWGGGGRIVFGPKTSERADKNAVIV